ncbi:MAG: hypothetical protein JRN20_06700 [Nitrososphaerota archaeon]|nr:hypothetical protein [Nitrososphaerota archaeon]
MRIKTANVRRYIDSIKARISKRNVSFVHGYYWLCSVLSSSRTTMGITFLLIIALALHFAALQLGMLIALGFCILELSVYRIANALFRFTRI